MMGANCANHVKCIETSLITCIYNIACHCVDHRAHAYDKFHGTMIYCRSMYNQPSIYMLSMNSVRLMIMSDCHYDCPFMAMGQSIQCARKQTKCAWKHAQAHASDLFKMSIVFLD